MWSRDSLIYPVFENEDIDISFSYKQRVSRRERKFKRASYTQLDGNRNQNNEYLLLRSNADWEVTPSKFSEVTEMFCIFIWVVVPLGKHSWKITDLHTLTYAFYFM